MSRSAPGRRVASGRLRVDAARAVAKLRDYQLLERRLWILEALRGAVGAGARSIRVDADADDVWVSWDGEPPAEEDLGALLDELVSPAVDPERRWARLMATAVNTALGEGTRWVDVWRLDGESQVAFRYAPTLLEERDHDDRALRPMRRDDDEPSAPVVPGRGVVIHVRRRFGLDVMGRWFVRGEAPELRLLEEVGAGARSRVPLTVQGEARERDGDVVLEVPLGERGRMVLLRATPGGGRPFLCRWAELGVPLSETAPLDEPMVTRPVPAALLYDSDRLPTNAARSEVRLGEGGLGHVQQEVVNRGLRDLVRAAADAYEQAEGDRRELLRESLLAWVGARCGGAGWRRALSTLGPELQPLRTLPLVRNAVGRWVCLDRIADGPVHVSSEPHEPDLEPWLGTVLWIPPGDPASHLLAGGEAKSPRRLVRHASRALAARRRWLEHQVRAPVIPDGDGQWLSLRFGDRYPRGKSALPMKRADREFEGEVCLLDPGAVAESDRGLGRIVLMREGRPIAQVVEQSAVPYVAVIASDRIEPTPDYTDAVLDAARVGAIETAHLFALRAIELVFGIVADPERAVMESVRVRGSIDVEQHGERLRAALVEVVADLGLRSKQVVSQLRGPFREAPLFAVADQVEGEGQTIRRLSLRELAKRFDGEPVIVVVRDPASPHHEGRPVALDPEAATLLRLRFPHVKVVTYDASIAARRPAMDEEAIHAAVGRSEWPMLTVDLGYARGAIAWSGAVIQDQRSTLLRLHRGVRIDQIEFEHAYEHCRVALDDDGLVPNGTWDSVVVQPDLGDTLGRMEQAMCRALVDALRGEPPPSLRLRRDIHEQVHVQHALLRAATHSGALDERRLEELWALPILPTVGGDPISLAALAAATDVAWLAPHEAYLEGLPAHLLVSGAAKVEVLEALVGRELRHADRELEQTHRERRRARNLEVHGQKPVRKPPVVGRLSVAFDPTGGIPGVVSVGSAHRATMQLEVRIGGRPFARRVEAGPPVDVVVDGPAEWATEAFDDLTDATLQMLTRGATERLGELLAMAAEDAPEVLHDDPVWGRVLEAWLDEHSDRGGEAVKRVRERLLHARVFPAARGGRASVADASTDKQVRVGEGIGSWLHPREGERSHALDRPILVVGEPHRSRIEQLAQGKAAIDVTGSMRRLQDERRVAQGLVERPTLPDVPAALKATIEELTSERSRWRIGEIGLVRQRRGTLYIHSGGRVVRTVPLDILPPVDIALESSNLAEETEKAIARSSSKRVRQLTKRLLQRVVLANLPTLPRWVDEAIREAFLRGGLLDAASIAGLPLFETTAGERVPWARLEEQHHQFGDVWVVTSPAYLDRTLVPLDPERLAVRASEDEREGFGRHGLTAVEATGELRLDARARANMARPRADRVDLPAAGRPSRLAQRPFETATSRGIVALLEGTVASDVSGIAVYRDGHPLGRMPSPVGWPLDGVVDAPGLTPNRVHDAPLEDEVWGRVMRAIIDARAALWRELIPEPPTEALAHRRVSYTRKAGLTRGRLWLVSPRQGGSLRVWFGRIPQTLTPKAPDGSTLPVRGELWVRAQGGKYELVQEVVGSVFPQLVERVTKAAVEGDAESFAVLLTGALSGAVDVSGAAAEAIVPGFAISLAKLLERRARGLDALRRALPDDPLGEAPEAIAAVMRRSFPQWLLTPRVARAVSPREPRVPDASPPPSAPKPKPRSQPKPESRPRPHALEPLARVLAHAVQQRLGVNVPVVVVPRRSRGLLRWNDSLECLELSGAHPMLVALQAQRLTRGPDVERAMRLLIAHAAGVLDRALTSVTEASQRSATLALLTL